MTIGGEPTKTDFRGDIPTVAGPAASDFDQSEYNPYVRLDELAREFEGNGALTSEQLEELKKIEPLIVRNIGTAMFHTVSTQEIVERPRHRPRWVSLQLENRIKATRSQRHAAMRSRQNAGTKDGLTAWYTAQLCAASLNKKASLEDMLETGFTLANGRLGVSSNWVDSIGKRYMGNYNGITGVTQLSSGTRYGGPEIWRLCFAQAVMNLTGENGPMLLQYRKYDGQEDQHDKDRPAPEEVLEEATRMHEKLMFLYTDASKANPQG